MKKRNVVYGAFGLLGLLLLAGGCKTQVMRDRGYVPIENNDAAYTPMLPTAVEDETVTDTTVVEYTTPVAPETKPVAKNLYPNFDNSSIDNSVAIKGDSYVVKKGDVISRIAQKYGVSTKALLDANGLDLNSAKRIRVGQTLIIPAGEAKQPVKKNYQANKTLVVDGHYVVVAGDNIPKIAKKLKVKTSDLMNLNKLDENSARRLQVGQKLIVPKGAKAEEWTKKTAPYIAQKKETKITHAEAISGTHYVIKSGDNIPKIAKMLNVKRSELMAANNLDDNSARHLQIGQKLIIPGRGAVAESAPAKNLATKPVAPVVTPVASTPVPPKSNDVLDNIEADVEALPTASSDNKVSVATDDVVTGSSLAIEVTAPITLEDFAKKYKVSLSTLENFNGKIPLVDGKIPAERIIYIPGK